MINTIILSVVAGYLLLCVVTALIRKKVRAAIRFWMVLLSAVLAFVGTLALKMNLGTAMDSAVLPLLETNAPEVAATLRDVTAMSPTLAVLLENCACSMLAPLLFLVLFILLSIATWVVYKVLHIIFAIPLKLIATSREWDEKRSEKKQGGKSPKKTKNKRKGGGFAALSYGVLHAALVIAVFMVPITCYLEISTAAIDEAVNAGVIPEGNAQAIVDRSDPTVSALYELNASPVVLGFRTYGGSAVYGALTDVKTESGDTVRIMDEIEPLTRFGCDIYKISQNTDVSGYGPEQAEILLDLSVSFGDSELLPTVAGEILYNVTGKWLAGESFWGVSKPQLGDAVDPIFDKMVKLLHDDSRVNENLKEDFATTAKVLAILARNQSFALISDTTALLKNLGESGAIEELIVTLGENSRMKVLIHDVTDLSMRAVALALGVPEDLAAIYNGFTSDVAGFINTLPQIPEEERDDAIAGMLTEKLDGAGIKLDGSLVRCVAIAMNEDLGKVVSEGYVITAENIVEFFDAYAKVADGGNVDITVDSDGRGDADTRFELDAKAGTVEGGDEFDEGQVDGGKEELGSILIYGGMDVETLKQTTFVGALSYFVSIVSDIDPDDASRMEKISEAYGNAFGMLVIDMAPARAEAIRDGIIGAFIKITDVADANGGVITLGSGADIVTSLVTVEDILRATASAELKDEDIQKQAEAFKTTLNKAIEIMNGMSGEGMSVETTLPIVGEVLDTLKDTPTVGADATGKLFAAIAQTDTVRDSIGMSADEALKMADTISNKVGDYSQAIDAVNVGMDIFKSLDGASMLSAENVEALVRVISPDTAKLMKEYFDADKLNSFGIADDKCDSACRVVQLLIDNIAERGESERDEDVNAVGNIFNLLIASSEKAYTDGAWIGDDGKLGTVNDYVTATLDSELGYATLIDAMTADGEIVSSYRDPFGASRKLSEAEKTDIANAIADYIEENPSKALGAEALIVLLGIDR